MQRSVSLYLMSIICFFSLYGIGYTASFTIQNTGIDNSGNLLLEGDIDSQYTLMNPFGEIVPAYAIGNGVGSWVNSVQDGNNAQWIAPDNPDENWLMIPGDWLYSINFDLTGFDVNSASISGQWSTDNEAVMYLNGIDTGISSPNLAYTDYHSFTITGGFLEGTNTLTFSVYNDGGPTGLLVNITDASADPSAVPEPTTIFLFGTGLTGLLSSRMRRKKNTRPSNEPG